MKHDIKNFLFIVVAVVFACSATVVFASSSISFPSDPRESPLPAGVRATAPINISGSNGIPTDRSLPGSSNNYPQNDSIQNNNFRTSGFAKLIIPLLLAFIAICFLAVIFFVARNIFFSR